MIIKTFDEKLDEALSKLSIKKLKSLTIRLANIKRKNISDIVIKIRR